MSNYFTETCFEFHPFKLSQFNWFEYVKNNKERFLKRIDKFSPYFNLLEDDIENIKNGIDSFEININTKNMSVTIFSVDGNVDIYSLASFIQLYLKIFKIEDIISFNYSFTCDKADEGSFGGGAVVVGKTDLLIKTTNDMCLEIEEEFKKELDKREVFDIMNNDEYEIGHA